ncbi:MAG: hypothetical protein Q8Q31_04600 [Nanoarchaeota archaeon]|nr:hypothetical protein [Nanoarchaeota archaeon]
MTLKKSQQVLAEGLYNTLLLNSNIPKSLLDEAQSFINRNSLVEKPLSGEKICCLRCLKAHLIKKSKAMNILPDYEELEKLTKEEAGHSGYYLDDDKLVEYFA